jgi:hypothetical protein
VDLENHTQTLLITQANRHLGEYTIKNVKSDQGQMVN